ncbi:MAG: metal-sulfur cluster assembly factor [Myxococcales bacterium]|nr:metal-sulfur cluster assembly factor [Myxococcales bacterium]
MSVDLSVTSDDPAVVAPIRAALAQVLDPELGIDIVELGLVRVVLVTTGVVQVTMTTTSPACPLGETLVDEVVARVRAVPGVVEVDVALEWEPPWGPDDMSEAARVALGWVS